MGSCGIGELWVWRAVELRGCRTGKLQELGGTEELGVVGLGAVGLRGCEIGSCGIEELQDWGGCGIGDCRIGACGVEEL